MVRLELKLNHRLNAKQIKISVYLNDWLKSLTLTQQCIIKIKLFSGESISLLFQRTHWKIFPARGVATEFICVPCVNLLQAPTQHHHSHTHLPPTHSGTLWQKHSTWGIAEGNCMFPQPFPIHITLEQLLRKTSKLDPFQESCCLWKAFPLSFLRFPPALGCLLPPPAQQQLGCSQGSCSSSQPGGKKQKACPAYLPLGGSVLLHWQKPPLLPSSLEIK